MWDFFIFLPRRNSCSSTTQSFNGVLTSELRRRETADMEACGKTCCLLSHMSHLETNGLSAPPMFSVLFWKHLSIFFLVFSCRQGQFRLTNSPHVHVLGLSGWSWREPTQTRGGGSALFFCPFNSSFLLCLSTVIETQGRAHTVLWPACSLVWFSRSKRTVPMA